MTRGPRIALILPKRYQGGVMRATLNMCRMIQAGSQQYGHPSQPVLVVPRGAFNPVMDLQDFMAAGIQVREATTRLLSPESTDRLRATAGREISAAVSDVSVQYRDGKSDLLDCDVWLLITNRTQIAEAGPYAHPVFPLRPLLNVPFDFVEQYVPDVMPDPTARQAVARVSRAADGVLVTQQQTGEDAIAFAGCRRDRVWTVPFEVDLPVQALQGARERRAIQQERSTTEKSRLTVLWPTNTSLHKNHEVVFKGLKLCVDEGVRIKVWMTGPLVHLYLSELADVQHLGEAFVGNWLLFRELGLNKRVVKILGYIGDNRFFDLMTAADLTLHSATYDNGPYAMVESSYLGVPSICSDYPQARSVAEACGAEPIWFSPGSPESFKAAIVTASHLDQRRGLTFEPDKIVELLDWRRVAPLWWRSLDRAVTEVAS